MVIFELLAIQVGVLLSELCEDGSRITENPITYYWISIFNSSPKNADYFGEKASN